MKIALLKSTITKIVTCGCLAAALAMIMTREASAWPWPEVNPEVYDSGRRVSGAYYDPFSGQVVVRSDRTRVRESYFDSARDRVDPGSRHYVDRIETDFSGVRWRVRGWSWTSFGVPHGNLTRTRLEGTGVPGVAHERNTTVMYSTAGGSVRSAAPRNSQPTNNNRRYRPRGYMPR